MTRMHTCADIDPLLTPYADGEASMADRRLVEAHLDRCPPCRGRVAAEQTARQVVRTRASALVPRASEELRGRCAAAASGAWAETLKRPPVAGHELRRWVPLSVAATVVLSVAGAFVYGLNTRLEAALAAQLALDHVKCFTVSRSEPGSLTAEQAEAWLETECGWRMSVPSSSAAENLTLAGFRRCLYSDGPMAHILYRWRTQPVSLFILPEAHHRRQSLEMIGHEAIIWSERDRTYALVGRGDPTGLARLANHFRSIAK